MSKLEEIYDGYKNLLTGDYKELGKQRAKICNTCEININGFCSKSVCIEGKGCGCGCLIKAKVVSPNSKCPIQLW